MSANPINRARALRQSGQSMIEYAIICGVLAVCLFAAQTPAGAQLAQAIRNFYADLTFFISLP
jgi:Flp pilus assembly pilin Flp